MAADIAHVSYQEQAEFLAQTPAQQNLRIYLNGKETNGAVAAAIKDIAVIQALTAIHDNRLTTLERWQLKAAAIIAAAILAAPGFFFLLARVWQ